MLSFIKHHMTSIDGIAIYPVISLIIFVLFFIALGVYTIMMRKEKVDYLKGLPLQDDGTENTVTPC